MTAASGRPTTSMISQHADREARHQPGLHAARQHAARHWPTVGHVTARSVALAVEVRRS